MFFVSMLWRLGRPVGDGGTTNGNFAANMQTALDIKWKGLSGLYVRCRVTVIQCGGQALISSGQPALWAKNPQSPRMYHSPVCPSPFL